MGNLFCFAFLFTGSAHLDRKGDNFIVEFKRWENKTHPACPTFDIAANRCFWHLDFGC